MPQSLVLICHWLPEGEQARWAKEFPQVQFVDARAPGAAERLLPEAALCYGLPDLKLLPKAGKLRWLQLASAGVPAPLCPLAQQMGLRVTNLAGLYGPTIAEHALALLLFLSRNLHAVVRNQSEQKWDRSVMGGLRDLHGKTLAIVGLGNIGQNIARLARALGMRVVGCRRTEKAVAGVDRVYSPPDVRAMLAEADHVAIAAPLIKATEGMLGREEFAALQPGGICITVSRGPIAQEEALIDALQRGHLSAAGLDVFAVEPLPPGHPFWTMPNVLVSPHYSGETVNQSAQPAQRFVRNLHSFLQNLPQEGVVDLEHGY